MSAVLDLWFWVGFIRRSTEQSLDLHRELPHCGRIIPHVRHLGQTIVKSTEYDLLELGNNPRLIG